MDPSLAYMRGWRRMHDRYYRRVELYKTDYASKLKLGKSHLLAAPHGGAIAVSQHSDLFSGPAHETPHKTTIDIVSSSGSPISSIQLDSTQTLCAGWDSKERLLLVDKDKKIDLYSLEGRLIKSIQLDDIQSEQIIDAKFCPNGAAFLTNRFHFLVLLDFDSPQTFKLKSPDLGEKPTCWIPVQTSKPPAPHSKTHDLQVFASTASGTLLMLSRSEYRPILSEHAPALALSADPAGQLLALFTSAGHLSVIQVNLGRVLSTWNTNTTQTPVQLLWCGSDSVICVWKNADLPDSPPDGFKLVLNGPQATFLEYHYRPFVYLVSEIDGARIFSHNSCEFLQRVPNEIETTHIPENPLGMICDAYDSFSKQELTNDQLFQTLKKQLPTCVTQLIRAALAEFNLEQQQKLLRVANLCKTFIDDNSPLKDELLHTCHTLRVLNHVRSPDIGIPLSYYQLKQITPHGLLQRLLSRHHHAHAYHIAKLLQLPTHLALLHWAQAKIHLRTKELQDDTQAKLAASHIISKFIDSRSHTPLLDLARTSLDHGLHTLASLLLHHDPHVTKEQLLLYFEMDLDDQAMKKATSSGSPDLIYYAILHAQSIYSTPHFFDLVSKHPLARSLYSKYLKERDQTTLKEFLTFQKSRDQLILHNLKHALSSRNFQTRKDNLRKILPELKPSSPLLSQLVADELKLLLMQYDLELISAPKFIGLSLVDTIYRGVCSNSDYHVKMVKEFKLSDKKYCWVKLHALVDSNNWEKLEAMATDKPPSIGIEPFVQACIDKNQPTHAARLIKKLKNVETQVKYYCSLHLWRDAYLVAKNAKNHKLLAQIRQTCPNSFIVKQIDDELNK